MILEQHWILFAAFFSALFTIVNPFSTASVFLTIARNNSKEEKRLIVKKACITAGLVLILFAVLGNFLLNFFGITIDAFRVAGGIIIVSIGYKMLHAGKVDFNTDKQKKEAISKEDISIIPLAIPMLSGPGAITTTLVLMGKVTNLIEVGLLFSAIIIVIFLSYFIISRADAVDKFIGENGKNVIDKVMGLIVLVVGVQFVINGITSILQGIFA
jgi:multiple antibiotic resistance protein